MILILHFLRRRIIKIPTKNILRNKFKGVLNLEFLEHLGIKMLIKDTPAKRILVIIYDVFSIFQRAQWKFYIDSRFLLIWLFIIIRKF